MPNPNVSRLRRQLKPESGSRTHSESDHRRQDNSSDAQTKDLDGFDWTVILILAYFGLRFVGAL